MKYLLNILFALTAFSVTAQDKWDLRRCVDYAIKNNISVKQNDVQARISALQLKQQQLNQYPSVAFNTSVSPQFGRSVDPTTYSYTTNTILSQSYNLQGSLTLYNWGRMKHTIESQKLSTQSAYVDIEKIANDISLNVANAYLTVLSSKEQIEVNEVQVQQSVQQLDIVHKQFAAGSVPELNVDQSEAKLASDSSNLISAQSAYDINLLSLKALLNLDMAAPFEVDVPDVAKIPIESFGNLQPDIVYQVALSSQPQQKSFQLKIKSAEENIKTNKAALYPTIGAGYGLSSNFANYLKGKSFGKWFEGYGSQINDNFTQNFYLGLSIPIFSNGQHKISYENAKLNLEDIKLQSDQADVTLKQNIYTAYSNAVGSFEKLNASKRNVESAQKAYDAAFKRYDIGLLGILDLITTQNSLTTAKLNVITDEYDYIFKMKLLEFYKGMGIKL